MRILHVTFMYFSIIQISSLSFGFGSPAPNQSNQATTVIGVISDLNGTECQSAYPKNSVNAFDNLLKLSPSHIIMPGDLVHGECLSYTGSKPYANVVSDMWQSFENNFFSKIPNGIGVSVAPGNHDAPWVTSSSRQTFKLENEGFRNYWNRKEPKLGVTRLNVSGAADNYPFYWAYVVDDILFVTLHSTTTSSLSDGGNQKTWLKALLSSSVAKNAKTRIVYGHVPPYPVLDPSVGSKYSAVLKSEQVGQANGLMDTLLDLDVDLMVVAHSHAPYPGDLERKRDGKRMKILSMPCGHAPRKLYTHSALSPRGFAMIKVSPAGEISMTVKTWDQGKEVPFTFFPSRIDVKDSRINYVKIKQDEYR